MRCTKRPIVETKATENPVRPCVLCCFELCADAGSVSGLKESKSASTWPNMVCSRPRLDWSPLREATEEPSSSELLETHFLLLVVRLLILSKKHIQRKINHTLLFVFWYDYGYFILGKGTFLMLPEWLRGSSGFRTWETMTDGSSFASSDWLCLDRTRWTATVAFRAATKSHMIKFYWWIVVIAAWNKSFWNSFPSDPTYTRSSSLLPVWSGALPDVQGVTGTLSLCLWSEIGQQTFCCCIILLWFFALFFRTLVLHRKAWWVTSAGCDTSVVINY